MALKKPQNLENGFNPDYLKLGAAKYDLVANVLSVVLEVYVSRIARQSGKQPVFSKVYQFENVLLQDVNTLAKVYAKLKTHADFLDAVDEQD